MRQPLYFVIFAVALAVSFLFLRSAARLVGKPDTKSRGGFYAL